MMFSPATLSPTPWNSKSYTSDGGNLAASTHVRLFSFVMAAVYRLARRSVGLSSNTQSGAAALGRGFIDRKLRGLRHLFLQQAPQKLLGQHTVLGRVVLPSPATAGAAIDRRYCPSAKSRPFPFFKVNHVAHWDGSRNVSSRKQKHNQGPFHHVGKDFPNDRHR